MMNTAQDAIPERLPGHTKDEELEGYGEWVAITRKVPPSKTEGGIYLPDTVRARMEPEFVGTVISIPKGFSGEPLQVGDRIVYSHCFPMRAAQDLEVVYALVHKNSIIGRMKKTSTLAPAWIPERQGLSQS
jgi:co-chaperonin GroES (HSP10)